MPYIAKIVCRFSQKFIYFLGFLSPVYYTSYKNAFILLSKSIITYIMSIVFPRTILVHHVLQEFFLPIIYFSFFIFSSLICQCFGLQCHCILDPEWQSSSFDTIRPVIPAVISICLFGIIDARRCDTGKCVIISLWGHPYKWCHPLGGRG